MKRSVLLSLLLIVFAYFTIISTTSAQLPNLGVASSYPINDADIVPGDIVSFDTETERISRTVSEYDEKMFGIVVDSAPIIIRSGNGFPVMQDGSINVNAVTLNGPIKIGDYVTSSTFPGKAQKATQSKGFILGRALSGLNDNEGTPITFGGKEIKLGTISVAIDIGPSPLAMRVAPVGFLSTAESYLTSLMSAVSIGQNQDRRVRFFIAGSVAVVIVLMSFITLGRNVTRGIESIGRNPMARMSIQSMIVLNVVMIVIICIIGIALSVAILTF